MTSSDAMLSVFVPGLAKTKGSMLHIGHGQMKQSVVGSTRWAILMAERFRDAWTGRPPMAGPLYCSLAFVLPGDPIAARAGDLDKLERNVWDALQPHVSGCAAGCKKHAGVIADDVLITQSASSKRQAGPTDSVGVHVVVGRLAWR